MDSMNKRAFLQQFVLSYLRSDNTIPDPVWITERAVGIYNEIEKEIQKDYAKQIKKDREN
jgi:hypothetical protein